MKKDLAVITAAVIAVGIGVSVFFGVKNAKKTPKEETITVAAVTETTTAEEKTTTTVINAAEVLTSKIEQTTMKENKTVTTKALKASQADFDKLADVLDQAYLSGYENMDPDSNEVTYRYPEYDCTKKDAYKNIHTIIPISGVEPNTYICLFGSTTYEKYFGQSINDPLGYVAERNKKYGDTGFWGYHKMNAEKVRIMVEEVFNLSLDNVLSDEEVKDHVYLYNGSCYSIVGRDGVNDRMTELVYSGSTQKSDGSYVVIFDARKMKMYVCEGEKQTYYGKVKVECSLKDYNGMRLWSIRKVGKA